MQVESFSLNNRTIIIIMILEELERKKSPGVIVSLNLILLLITRAFKNVAEVVIERKDQ